MGAGPKFGLPSQVCGVRSLSEDLLTTRALNQCAAHNGMFVSQWTGQVGFEQQAHRLSAVVPCEAATCLWSCQAIARHGSKSRGWS